jgi:hypothetical protein
VSLLTHPYQPLTNGNELMFTSLREWLRRGPRSNGSGTSRIRTSTICDLDRRFRVLWSSVLDVQWVIAMEREDIRHR